MPLTVGSQKCCSDETLHGSIRAGDVVTVNLILLRTAMAVLLFTGCGDKYTRDILISQGYASAIKKTPDNGVLGEYQPYPQCVF